MKLSGAARTLIVALASVAALGEAFGQPEAATMELVADLYAGTSPSAPELAASSRPHALISTRDALYFLASTSPDDRPAAFRVDESGVFREHEFLGDGLYPFQLLAESARGVLVTAQNDSESVNDVYVLEGGASPIRLFPADYLVCGKQRLDNGLLVVATCYLEAIEPNRSLPSELWATDGTVEGTRRLTLDSDAPQAHGGVVGPYLVDESLIRFRDSAVFAGVRFEPYPESWRSGLWITDGTLAGTRPLLEFTEDEGIVRAVVPLSERFAIWLQQRSGYFRLLLSDGTVGETREVDLDDAEPEWLADEFAVGSTLLWTDLRLRAPFQSTENLWRLDSGIDNSAPEKLGEFSEVSQVTKVGRRFFFVARTESPGRQRLFASDGTKAGTREVELDSISPTPPDEIRLFDSLDGGVVFATDTPERGYELSWSNGTPDGTFPLPEIEPGPDSPTYWQISEVVAWRDKVYVSAFRSDVGYELLAFDRGILRMRPAARDLRRRIAPAIGGVDD